MAQPRLAAAPGPTMRRSECVRSRGPEGCWVAPRFPGRGQEAQGLSCCRTLDVSVLPEPREGGGALLPPRPGAGAPSWTLPGPSRRGERPEQAQPWSLGWKCTV